MAQRAAENTNNRNSLLLGLAWLLALVATLGSLYYSEIRHFLPCELCWYQRILMYPLAVVLGIAVWRGDFKVRIYVLPLAAIGGSISFYHYLVEKVPGFGITACKPPVPCNVEYVNYFGFITIAFMALVAFIAIIVALSLIRTGPEDR